MTRGRGRPAGLQDISSAAVNYLMLIHVDLSVSVSVCVSVWVCVWLGTHCMVETVFGMVLRLDLLGGRRALVSVSIVQSARLSRQSNHSATVPA
jgi:hypothetical protein